MLMSAGNLATTQAVVSLLDERTKAVAERRADVARDAVHVPDGPAGREHGQGGDRQLLADAAQTADSYFNASFILGGQIRGTEPRLFMIYPEGNFIESSEDTPFFQIGETKYGKPIIVRAYDAAMSFAETVKLLIVSFNSTLKSNLSVGLPLDLLFLRKGQLQGWPEESASARTILIIAPISDGWSNALKQAFKSLPDFPRHSDESFPRARALRTATSSEPTGEGAWTATISENGRAAPPTGAPTIATQLRERPVRSQRRAWRDIFADRRVGSGRCRSRWRRSSPISSATSCPA